MNTVPGLFVSYPAKNPIAQKYLFKHWEKRSSLLFCSVSDEEEKQFATLSKPQVNKLGLWVNVMQLFTAVIYECSY